MIAMRVVWAGGWMLLFAACLHCGEFGEEDRATAEEAWPLPPEWAQVWTEWAADADLRENGADSVRYRLLAGDPAVAAAWLCRARGRLPFTEAAWREHAAWATATLRAAAGGDPLAGREYAGFLVHGPNGPDGKPGTEDDLADPLSALAATAKNATMAADD